VHQNLLQTYLLLISVIASTACGARQSRLPSSLRDLHSKSWQSHITISHHRKLIITLISFFLSFFRYTIFDIRYTIYYLHIFSITFKNPSFFEK